MTERPAGRTDAEQAVPTAAAPLGVPAAASVSVLLCLALVALGAVALREVAVGAEVLGTVPVPGEVWLAPLLGAATSLVQGTTAALVGLGGLVLGYLVVAAAVAGRPARSVRLGGRRTGQVPVDLDGAGVAAFAADAALAHPEVGTSRARGSRRRLTVDVSVDPRDAHDEAALAEELTTLVQQRLQDLTPPPRLRVRVHGAVPR